MKRWLLLFLLFAAPAESGALRRYTFRPKDSSADPSARIPQFFVADAESDCPSSGDLGDADLCFALAEDSLRVRAAGAWVALGGSVTLAGDVDGASGSNDLDEANVENELEGVLDLQDQQGAVTDAQVPNTITVDLATLATTATTANAGDSATSFFPSGTLEDARVDGSAEADEVNPTLGTQTQGNYALGDAEGGAATTGDSATSFFSTGTLEDARVDGSAEADEVNPTLGTQTQGNYALGDSEGGAATTGDSASSFFGAGAIEAARGGTGIDTSASSGLPRVASGTWSVGTMPVTQILLCPPGMSAANLCVTYTDLGAAFSAAGAGGVVWADLAGYTEYRISVLTAGTGATTGDVVVQCDTVVNFAATPTTLGQVDNPGANAMTCSTSATCSGSSWAAIGAGECLTAGGIFIRAGMANGNTSEDPILRRVTLELR